MLRQTKVAVSFVLVAFSLMVAGTPDANAASKLPDPIEAGIAEKLFRLDCGHSLANDESVWTPGENVGRSIEFSSTCWLIKHGSEWLLWDTGVPESALNNPRGWSTLPKLIVYHLDKTLTDQLAEIGLKPRDVTRVAISHTHGDHIGNMGLFPNSTILMQQAEYRWINSADGPNDNVNQLMALARKLLGTPKNLQLIDGDTDVFGDGSVTLVSTPGHTPGHQSLLVHLNTSPACGGGRRAQRAGWGLAATISCVQGPPPDHLCFAMRSKDDRPPPCRGRHGDCRTVTGSLRFNPRARRFVAIGTRPSRERAIARDHRSARPSRGSAAPARGTSIASAPRARLPRGAAARPRDADISWTCRCSPA
jgi:N-acyl homoserine lactone hydrolase